jgi:hypothetical protein
MRRVVRRSSETRRANAFSEGIQNTCDPLHNNGSGRRLSVPHLLTVHDQHIPERRYSYSGLHSGSDNKKANPDSQLSNEYTRTGRGINYKTIFLIVTALLIILIFSFFISLYKLLTWKLFLLKCRSGSIHSPWQFLATLWICNIF